MKALEAAHEQAARLSNGSIDATGWPENIATVTAMVQAGTVGNPNTGHECDSGAMIVIRMLGTFAIPIGGGGGAPDSGGSAESATVHAVNLTADSHTGLVCLISVQTGTVSSDPDATVIFQR